jgi:xanthine dehydrogenase YagS FAD-binding subunit
MRDFLLARAGATAEVIEGLTSPATALLAGGTELLNWMRLGIAEPERVIDIGRIPDLDRIVRVNESLRIGALATLNAVGEHPLVREHATALAEACLSAASAQIRNRATLGGNVLQKTRCPYFRAEAPLPWACNKREPGTGCAAREGINERHAILGWTDACVATMPSDPAVALACLDATVEVLGPAGTRMLEMTDFHLTPAEAEQEASAGRMSTASPAHAAQRETRLMPGEMIIAYRVPIVAGQRSAYLKVRERASYEYALVSAAASTVVRDGQIVTANVALGSVAQKPWRLTRAEAELPGKPPVREQVLPAIRQALSNAKPLQHNGYKVTMAANAAARALVAAGGAA